jgi:hypothetical protein
MRNSVESQDDVHKVEPGRRHVMIAPSSLNAGGLRVEFLWCGDRFAHVLSLVDPDGDAIPLWRSEEGEANPWRPCPPLQDLSIETLPDARRVALLVGKAGRGHWSASIETVSGQAALLFDIACRTDDGDTVLGSTYYWAAPATAHLFVAADRSWIEARYDNRAVIIVPSREAATPSVIEMVGSAAFAIRPEGQPGSGTIRWKYQVELLTSDV